MTKFNFFLVFQDSGEDAVYGGQNTKTISLQIKEFWTSISIGGFSEPSNRFYEKKLTNTATAIEVYCPKGVISLDPETAYYGLINEDEYAIYTMY